MSTFARLVFASLFATLLLAQSPPPIRVDGIALPWIDRFETIAASSAPMSARTAALVTLAWLRLADEPRARVALAACCAAADLDAGADRVDPAWAAAASLWYLRATHDDATVRQHLPRVAASLEQVHDDASRPNFADEALLVHGMLCVAAVESFLDLDRPGDASRANGWSRRAVERWLDVERRAWQPGREHFRPRLSDDSLVLPEPADESVLWPAAAGMLVATGDRATRHARTVLHAAFSPRTNLDARDERFGSRHASALLLATATQFADASARRDAWTRLVADASRADPTSDVAAFELDAALFAITGVRLATGAGVDEGWLRIRPWLPPERDHVHVRGIQAEGTRFDLDIERRDGDLAPDETSAEEAGTPAGERLRVRITVAASAQRPVRLVLQGPSIQFVTSLDAGSTFTRSLPVSEP